MKKFSLHYQWYDSDLDEPMTKMIHEADELMVLVGFAGAYARHEPAFRGFEWDDFKDITHFFYVVQWEYELIEGVKNPTPVSIVSMEILYPVLYDAPELNGLYRFNKYNQD